MTAKYQADVVIAGGGLAGLVTAMELLDHGRSVVMLERGPSAALGGLARLSFGGIFLVGSPQQRRTGIRDTPDLALADWVRYGELGDADELPRQWAEAYVSGCREHVYDWLTGNGVRFMPVVQWAERGLDTPGNTVPRFHIVWGTGPGLVGALRRQLDAHPQRQRLLILYRHRVTDLVSEAGRVCGCAGAIEADEDGRGVNVGRDFVAQGDCVVVASGGIMGNLDLVRAHWPTEYGSPPQQLLNGAHPVADGHLHQEAANHGARVGHLDRMWLYAAGVEHWKPEFPGHGIALIPPKSALWVDAEGRRIGPRPLVGAFDTRRLVKSVAQLPHQYSWQVLNWRIGRRELVAQGAEFNHAIREHDWGRLLKTIAFGDQALLREFIDNCPDFVTGSSVAQLAAAMNELTGDRLVDAAVLETELQRYDEAVAQGKASTDEQVKLTMQARRYRADRLRTCRFAKILDPKAMPLVAIRERLLTRKSLGGIQTDLKGRALAQDGTPVPGLYAVGEAAGFGGGGVHGIRSLEGTFLGGCVFTGRLAAQGIARG